MLKQLPRNGVHYLTNDRAIMLEILQDKRSNVIEVDEFIERLQMDVYKTKIQSFLYNVLLENKTFRSVDEQFINNEYHLFSL